jgi:ATP-dependent Clp protease ATP-binding subunit ClpB
MSEKGSMNLEYFTQSTQALLAKAVSIATEQGHASVGPIHVLAASLEDEFCCSFYRVLHVEVSLVKEMVARELAAMPRVKGGSLVLDPRLEDFLKLCKKEADALDDSYVSLEHILMGLALTKEIPHVFQGYFKRVNFTKEAIMVHMNSIRKGRTVNSKHAEQQYQSLEKYCQNITAQARAGRLDPVIGRHEEIHRVIQILSRRTKNNPVLIGEPGVGKTAIVEGIAQRITNNDVPESLKGSTVYSLDLGLLVAGAKYQGEFEERLKSVLKEIEESADHIIIFIDELHMLVGAGASGSGGMDASNLLKPALARGLLHCIGATTIKEYKKYIEKDAALERRFQPVMVEEPSIEDAISILRGLKERYEVHHGIHIKDQALVNAVVLSARNIPERFLPDKAIDLVDEAAAMVKMSIDSQPLEVDRIERRIRQLEIERLALGKEKGSEAPGKLAELEQELLKLKEQLQTLVNQWKAEKAPLDRINRIKEEMEQAQIQFQRAEREGNFAKASEIKYGQLVKLQQELQKEVDTVKQLPRRLIKEEVDEQDIAKVLSRWTGIPAEKLQASETEKLLTMEEILRSHVIGQDEAIAQVTQAIQLHRAGLIEPDRPIGTFLFLGPTGVGKTEIAKVLAQFLFNDQNRLVRIDMSEYMEMHAVARLIGAPPGYIGFEEGGQLTEAVRRHPYSVILIDEIEKAHPDVFNIFLQILDEGRLTDSQGRTVSFKNTIIIMTSNIGSDIMLASNEVSEKSKKLVKEQLHKVFRPEFLNRIDAIVFFRKLSHSDVVAIAQLQIKELVDRLAERNIVVSVTPQVIDKIAELGYEPEFGARPLKRALQQHVALPIAQLLLRNPDRRTVQVQLLGDTIIFI